MNKLVAIVMVVMLVFVAGCSNSKETSVAERPSSDFVVTLEGVADKTELSFADFAELNYCEMTSNVTNKNGETKTNLYGGVLLKDILKMLGVPETAALTIEATDGYVVNYTSELAFADDVIFAWVKDSEVMSDNAVYITPAEASGKTLAKYVAKLSVQ